MGEYGIGLTSGQCFNMDKERIRHALQGELFCEETVEGFEYGPAPKEECDKYILHAFDNAVFQCSEALAGARALEKMFIAKNGSINLQKYMRIVEEEKTKYNDYIYESID